MECSSDGTFTIKSDIVAGIRIHQYPHCGIGGTVYKEVYIYIRWDVNLFFRYSFSFIRFSDCCFCLTS